MKVGLVLLLAFFFSFDLAASVISMPEHCLEKRKSPCVIKTLQRESLMISSVKIVALKDSLIKINDFEQLNVEPLSGGLIVKNSDQKVRIGQYILNQYPSYAVKTKDQLEVIDGQDLYSNIIDEGGVRDRYLLDRDAFFKKIISFYKTKGEFVADFKGISKIYKNSFKQDIQAQKRVLSRKIASVEEEKKKQEERKKQIRLQQQLHKELLFQRTFKQ